ncbi:MAG TPA: TRAP transporter substrate-binding protein [Stellaceae bacterium]|jgi:TRAP-type C4-dicarboxylate transport system substrate-binding protein
MKNGAIRRALFITLAAVAVAAAPAVASAEDAVTLKFGFPAPITSYVNTDGMAPWIDAVEKASGGTLKIKLFAGETLASVRNVYERTLSGVSQISFGIFGPYAGQFPRTQVADLPFLSPNATVSSVALWRVYASGLLAPEYRNVKVLALFNFPSAVLNTHKPIATLDDLKGMKIAVSSRTAADVMQALGASPVTLTPPETYEGISRGVADGADIAWTAVRTFRLAEVTKYHLDAPLGEAPAFVFMNKATYASLPAKAKAAIDKYSGESFSQKLGMANEVAGAGEAKTVAAQPGQSVTKLSPAQYAVWEARIQPVIDAWVKPTPDGAKVLAAYRAEIQKIAATN